jgi:aminoglycoside phosphotransferase (APT) family kinase protein
LTGDVLERRPPAGVLRWVASSIGTGSRVVAVRALPSSWLANHAVDVVDGHGTTHELVLRRWARPGWDLGDPEMTAAHEAGVLDLLANSTVPAPELVAADPDADHCDVPALLITRLGGEPPRTPPPDQSSFLEQLAGALPAIHAVHPGGRVHGYSPYHEPDRVAVPAWSDCPELWERAIAVFAAPAPETETRFIHRDYHPGNTLWSGGRLTGIVDWTAASVGPPALDVSHMRLNLAREIGLGAAEDFAAHHHRVCGEIFENQAYWDVVDAADALPELDRAEFPAVERYLAAALARL